eukprot:486355_1
MAATATPEIAMESIIPLLRIARKIEKCNASQLSAVAKQLISIFDIKMTFPIPNGHDGSMYEIQPESLVKSSNDLDALTNEILRFVCHNHHKFTNLQFETIESILPHDLQLDDSIAKSTEYHLKPLTLIKLPTVIIGIIVIIIITIIVAVVTITTNNTNKIDRDQMEIDMNHHKFWNRLNDQTGQLNHRSNVSLFNDQEVAIMRNDLIHNNRFITSYEMSNSKARGQ